MEQVLRRIPSQLIRASSHGPSYPCLRHLTQADMPILKAKLEQSSDKGKPESSKHGTVRMTEAGPLASRATDSTNTWSKDSKQPRFVARDADSLSKLASKSAEKVRMTEAGPLASKSSEKQRMTEAGPLTGETVRKSDSRVKDSEAIPDWRTSTTAGSSSQGRRSTNTINDKETSRVKHGLESMKAWQIPDFGDISSLQLVDQVNVPMLADPFGNLFALLI